MSFVESLKQTRSTYMVSVRARAASTSSHLTGLLSLLAGYRILEVTGSETLASGYFVNASRSLASIGGEGVCQMLQNRFPSYVSGFVGAIEPSLQSLLNMAAPSTPPMLRAPPSASNATTRTTDSDSLPADDLVNADNLDTVTLVLSCCPELTAS